MKGRAKNSEAGWIIVFLEGLRNLKEVCSSFQKGNQLGICLQDWCKLLSLFWRPRHSDKKATIQKRIDGS